MAYFDKFGYTLYQIGSNQILVRDFIKGVAFKFDASQADDLFDEYSVQDNEKLENISYNFYGSTGYHWVLAFVNGILDQNNDLPKSDEILRKAASKLYSNIDGIHHWENSENPGEWVDSMFPTAFPVTNIEYMNQLNEQKRLIKILKPIYLSNFVSAYMDQVASSTGV